MKLDKLRDEMAKDAEEIYQEAYGCPDIAMRECIPVISNRSFDAARDVLLPEAVSMSAALENAEAWLRYAALDAKWNGNFIREADRCKEALARWEKFIEEDK